MSTFTHVLQPGFDEAFNDRSPIKGTWKNKIFGNLNPLVIELGCGKGEYTTGLARQYTGKNFIGIDIKGARMWVGASLAEKLKLPNVRFLRTRIEFINSFFAENEVDEIWITFPDPQPKVRRTKKRICSALFLNSYNRFLVAGGKIHLKTDCRFLYEYTLELLRHNGITPEIKSTDLYSEEPARCEHELLNIQTFYESMFREKGIPITYLRFSLHKDKPVTELDDDVVKNLLEKYETKQE